MPTLPSSTHIAGDSTHIIDHNELAAAAAAAVYGANNLSDVADPGSSRANIHVPVLTPCACVATVNVSTMSGPGGATTIASGSNSLALPQATINVASASSFPSSGTINVVTGAGTQSVTYTGTTGTTFTGCSGGTGTMSTGGAVTATFDGYLLAATDMVLLTAQTTASQNGPWVIPAGVSGAWTRPAELATGLVVKSRTVRVLHGANYANSEWTLVAPTAGLTVDTTAQTWTTLIPAASIPIVNATIIRATTGAPTVLSSDQTGDFAFDSTARVMYGPLGASPNLGQPWAATTVAIPNPPATASGLTSWTFDPSAAANTAIVGTAGTAQVVTVPGITGTLTYLWLNVTTGGATLTANQNFAAVYQAGTLLSATPDVSGTTFTVATTSSSATVTGTAFTAGMVGAQYTVAGVAGTYTVSAVASSTSLTMSATLPTTVSGATMTSTANYSWLSTGNKQIKLVTPVSVGSGAVQVVFWANGTTLPTFARGQSGAVVNLGPNIRYGIANTGLTTAAPGTLSTVTALGTPLAWLVGLS